MPSAREKIYSFTIHANKKKMRRRLGKNREGREKKGKYENPANC
jgi:hypothetical protein